MNVSDEIEKILSESRDPRVDLQILRDKLRQHLKNGFPTGSWWANDVLIEGAIEQLRSRKKSKKTRT